MATQRLHTVQIIPCTLSQAWEFFTNPDNLRLITPDYLDFNIVSKYHGAAMYPGQLIEYRVKPLLRIPVYWMTEITQVEQQKYFVDEQRFGPYRFWHHQHHFRAVNAGVEMTDIVHWRAPMGILGNVANRLFLRERVEGIFAYRFQKVNAIFKSATAENAY
ncbi:MAG TPA: SRPBCC family protein [Puia sp.]|nr:SRPBCC family protein [Puia sp.]